MVALNWRDEINLILNFTLFESVVIGFTKRIQDEVYAVFV